MNSDKVIICQKCKCLTSVDKTIVTTFNDIVSAIKKELTEYYELNDIYTEINEVDDIITLEIKSNKNSYYRDELKIQYNKDNKLEIISSESFGLSGLGEIRTSTKIDKVFDVFEIIEYIKENY
jgi:hypothetical protein